MSKKLKSGKKKKNQNQSLFQQAAQQVLDKPQQQGGQFLAYDPNKQNNIQVLNAQGQPQYVPQFIQNPSQLNQSRLNQSMQGSARQSQYQSRMNSAAQPFTTDLQFKQPLTLDQDFFKDNLQNLNQALYGLFRKERDVQVKKEKQKFEQEDRIHRIISQQQEILTHLVKDLEEDRKRKEREQALESTYEYELDQNNYLDKFSENQKKIPEIEDVLEKEMWNFYCRFYLNYYNISRQPIILSSLIILQHDEPLCLTISDGLTHLQLSKLILTFKLGTQYAIIYAWSRNANATTTFVTSNPGMLRPPGMGGMPGMPGMGGMPGMSGMPGMGGNPLLPNGQSQQPQQKMPYQKRVPP